MKKCGKYENHPEGTAKKQPKVKSMLLQAYLTSLLCLVLCVTMFFGTSYAWFTSEVNNEGNEIYVGTLKAKLEKLGGDGNWVELSAQSNEKLYDRTTCWEPGYTSMETVKITNGGDLAFRYVLTFTDGMLDGAENDTELIKVAQHFAVYVHAGEFTDADPKPASFADIKASAEAEDGTWQAVCMGKDPATLADILTRELPVLSGNMEEKTEADTYIIALHMLETAGQGATDADSIAASQFLMGKTINMNVKLTAYQRTHESDAFDTGYDLQAHVTDLGPVTVSYKRWENFGNTPGTETIDLDAAYQFQPVESSEEGQLSPYKKYIADFVITADQPVALNTIALAGYYELFCKDFNADDWIVLESNSSDVITPDMEVRLVCSMGEGLDITYEMLCNFGNDGIGFLCGLKNNSSENIGKTITVQLRLYETQLNDQGHYVIADITKYIVAATETYYIAK